MDAPDFPLVDPLSPPPPIAWAGMARARYSAGRPLGPARLLVLHATAGSYPGDHAWLRAGGGDTPGQQVSCHYYIDPLGRVSQFVRDEDTAWHCGPSQWTIDGQRLSGSYRGVAALNWRSIGVELSNRNSGHAPYPAAQIRAAVGLFRHLIARYQIPIGQVVRHRDIAPGRKTDPAGFPWQRFLGACYPATSAPAAQPVGVYTELSPVLGSPPVPALSLAEAFFVRCQAAGSPYASEPADPIRRLIVPVTIATCLAGGVDPYVALAQLGHESDWLASALAQRRDKDGRDLRNGYGIGVWEGKAHATPHRRPGTVYDADAGGYRPAVGFSRWEDAIVAQVGRLIAYATRPQGRTDAQQRLVERALGFRDLPLAYHGSAPRLKALGKAHNPAGAGWASPGTDYGHRLAEKARSLYLAAGGR